MGIDYGRGLTNVDNETGIRYGVINQQYLLQAWCDESAPHWGSPMCGACGAYLDYDIDDGHECECGHVIEWVGEECYGHEPVSHYVADSEYTAECGEDGDIFITKSKYYTKCGFCSPCAPGAGYLTDRSDDCKAYCFDPEWFDGECPYPVYRVSDDTLVE